VVPHLPVCGYGPGVEDLGGSIERVARESEFSGAVRVDRGDEILFAKAFGLADRERAIPNSIDTRFGIASGTKGLTALTAVRLIEDGVLEWSTTARSVLGSDLPLIDDAVTLEHLLAHRSGIGDYFDEDEHGSPEDFVLPVPPNRLVTTEDYLAVLDGHPQKFPPGDRFSYCNSGFVVLALIAERASGTPFHDLVRTLVCEPAGMRRTAFLRSDTLPVDAAIGYLAADGLRTNAAILPALGSGDGGISSTVADIQALWRSLFEGRIVSRRNVERMTHPVSDVPSESKRYGLGFWLAGEGPAVILEGYDAGISFRSVHHPREITYTVVSNWTDGAWPLARFLRDAVRPD
jgi:CubicO group peptidase (beta-lactamase class C family)